MGKRPLASRALVGRDHTGLSWLADPIVTRMAEVSCTQVELADHIGISQKHLSQLLTGKIVGSLDLYDRLCEGLDVRPVLTLVPR